MKIGERSYIFDVHLESPYSLFFSEPSSEMIFRVDDKGIFFSIPLTVRYAPAELKMRSVESSAFNYAFDNAPYAKLNRYINYWGYDL